MSKTFLVGLAVALSVGSTAATAADIINGWSSEATISTIHSEGSRTLFRLTGITDSCGHPDMWNLPLDDTAAKKAKLSMLLAAFAANKKVSLRCENGEISDFRILGAS